VYRAARGFRAGQRVLLVEPRSVVAVFQAPNSSKDRPVLVASSSLSGAATEPDFSKSAILRAVARKGLPNLIEATLVPAVLFYVLVVTVSGTAAIIAAMRSNSGMKVEARSPGGGRIRDYYSLDGAPLAIDAAAACAATLANR